jgi:hypothetical protein
VTRRPRVLTLLLVAACVPVWLAAGWLLALFHLQALDLVGRICLLFLFLSIAEIPLARFVARDHHNPADPA